MTAKHIAATEQRRQAMATLNAATAGELTHGLERLGALPPVEDLRPPEIGMVMARGRMGGTGQPFNVGEATVTRAVVRLADGTTGFGYRLGRSPELARASALIDALWQSPGWGERIERDILAPIRQRLAATGREKAAAVAATRVEFFTLVRGED